MNALLEGEAAVSEPREVVACFRLRAAHGERAFARLLKALGRVYDTPCLWARYAREGEAQSVEPPAPDPEPLRAGAAGRAG